MTLGNMRQNGVRGLDVTCSACGHQYSGQRRRMA
jgi:hypothetical protein